MGWDDMSWDEIHEHILDSEFVRQVLPICRPSGVLA